MPVAIYETTISESADATSVHLYVSDAPRDDTRATFHLQIRATLPLYREPLLAQIQREALKQTHWLYRDSLSSCPSYPCAALAWFSASVAELRLLAFDYWG